ncbi:AraC-like DNA-binding protein [Dysgonomonas hofstadii]|uniref:AraC-like DNA-binding protein n=1 Tax=Dysgonomonas hofstadii TaxID=637886 RepID=A0A840CJ67_9BACT|nr:AraC family transcriptional regulator [Dysgonomonas hofstadii]MBB4036000.1 AraC-like DNA-binding protein [Dysgonomonas hofstadii]
MTENKHIFLNQLNENPFIEIFRLEELTDDTIFGNYQRYDFYQLLWFTKVSGDTTYFLDFEEYTLEENQFILIFPGQIDKLDPQGKEGFLYAIHNDLFFRISEYIQSDYLRGYVSNAFLKPDKQTESMLRQLNGLLLQESRSENRLPLMISYMQSFLYLVSSLHSPENGKDTIVGELMRLIDTHFIHQRETEFYADCFGMSCKTINEISKKGTGKTVKQHLQERLIIEIKKEIRIGKKNLKEIAFDLGFNEAAYFTRFFKQQTSQTPTEFRDS